MFSSCPSPGIKKRPVKEEKKAATAQGYTPEEAAALLEFDEALLRRLLGGGGAAELAASVHAAAMQLTDPKGGLNEVSFLAGVPKPWEPELWDATRLPVQGGRHSCIPIAPFRSDRP